MEVNKAWTRMFLADEVKKAVVSCDGLQARFGTLASHCYNQSKPNQTVWWLFPKAKSTYANWPAYHFGKYFFARAPKRGAMRVGLHVEKGLSEEAAKGYGPGKAKHFGMTSSWVWHSFLDDLEAGRVSGAVDLVLGRCTAPIELEVEPSFALDELENHVRETPGHHRFSLLKAGGLRLLEESPQPKKLEGVGQVASLQDLGARLRRAIKEEPWTWVNLFIEAVVPCQTEAPAGAGDPWSGSDFWGNVLEPFAGWVR